MVSAVNERLFKRSDGIGKHSKLPILFYIV